MKNAFTLLFMAALPLCAGCTYHFAQSNVLSDCSKAVQQRTAYFLNDIVDSRYEAPPPQKLIKFLGNSISETELTRLYGKLNALVYTRLSEMVAENDKSKVIFYVIEIYDDVTSRRPVDVVIVCLNEGIGASGPVSYDSMFIDIDTKDYTALGGGVWDM